jgi:hypothetical protein
VRFQSFKRCRVRRHLTLDAGVHVDAVDALTVGGVGEADGKLAGVVLGLCYALGQRLVPRLRLDRCQPGVAKLEHVVGGERFAPVAVTLDPAECDRVLAPDAATFDDAPAGCRQCGVDVFGSGFGFVHIVVSRRLATSLFVSHFYHVLKLNARCVYLVRLKILRCPQPH